MTEQQEKDLAIVSMDLEGRQNPPLERLLADYKQLHAKLDCVRRAVTDSLPRLDEAFRRYGCTSCGLKVKGKCTRAWPCQAKFIGVVANDLRDCLGIPA